MPNKNRIRRYTSRLWCVVELFIYLVLHSADGGGPEGLQIRSIAGAEDQVLAGLRTFDAGACECFNPRDKEHLLRIVHRSSGSLDEFSQRVRLFERVVQQRPAPVHAQLSALHAVRATASALREAPEQQDSWPEEDAEGHGS